MNTATAITIAALAALTPTVTCLIGIVLSRQDVRRLEDKLESRMDQRFDSIAAHLAKIDDHLMAFYNVTGRLEGRIDAIEKRRN